MANVNYNLVVASQLGALLGMNLIRIKRTNVDADYSNKEREGKQRLVNPIWLHGVERIRIRQAELVDVGDGKMVVQFNRDPKLQLDLAGAKDISDIIKKPTVQEVVSAIASESTGLPQFFTDDKTATELTISFNERSRKEISSMMETLSRQAQALADANRAMEDSCRLNMAQYGQSVNFQSVNID